MLAEMRGLCLHHGRRQEYSAIKCRQPLMIESRWSGAEGFSAPVQTGPWGPPGSYTMGTGSFPGVERPGCGVDHQPSSSAEFKNR